MVLPGLQKFLIHDYKLYILILSILTPILPKFTEGENNAKKHWESNSYFSSKSQRVKNRRKGICRKRMGKKVPIKKWSHSDACSSKPWMTIIKWDPHPSHCRSTPVCECTHMHVCTYVSAVRVHCQVHGLQMINNLIHKLKVARFTTQSQQRVLT